MPFITIRTARQDLDEIRRETQQAAEQEVLRRLAEALRPTVLQGVVPFRFPPVFVDSLVDDIRMQWTDLQFQLQQVRAECERYKDAEARLRNAPIRDWLSEARAAEKTARERAETAEAEVTRLKFRLEAEQRARADDVAERDAKIADLNRLLTQLHLSRVHDDDDS
jgi:hypothetical protein